jgi:hypothetical protein
MASASNSDDSSDIFWPGYVDAVTNLAINLLFVVAIMSIVVITATLQISKMKPDDGVREEVVAEAQSSLPMQAQQAMQQAKTALADARLTPQTTPLEMQQTMQQAEAALEQAMQTQKALVSRVEAQQKRLQELEKQAQAQQGKAEQDRAALAQGKSAKASLKKETNANRDGGTTVNATEKAQVVQARENTMAAAAGVSEVQDLTSGGVVVVFDTDVIELSDKEVRELVSKLSVGGPIAGGRWQLRVVSPKGFSEATRMAYYRLNNLRNNMIKNGANPQDIEMRVVEAEGDAANNARVLVRLMP